MYDPKTVAFDIPNIFLKPRSHANGYSWRQVSTIFRNYKRLKRPWWKHPKWHVHHWRIQIHPLQHFKRWAFTRCSACGGSFKWGESPVSHQWFSSGPQWFKSEEVEHVRCCGPSPVKD